MEMLIVMIKDEKLYNESVNILSIRTVQGEKQDAAV
jgi:hypothetical protein